MKSNSSKIPNLRSERGSAVYSFLGFAIVAVCVIMAIFVFPWHQLGSSGQDTNYLSGMGALKNKQYTEALSYFDKSIRGNANNGAAYLGRAKANLHLGNIDKALDDANQAVEKKAGAEAYGQRGVIKKIQKKTDEALKDFAEAIKLDAKYAWAYAQRADIFSKQKDYDKALKDANDAVKANDRFVEGYRLRAWVLTRQGKCKDASLDFITVEKLSPNDALSMQDKAWFLLTCPDEKLQDTAKAMELAKKAVEISKEKDGVALETLAEACFRQGDALKAVEYQKKAIALGSKNCPDGSCVKEMQQRLQKYELASRQEVRSGYEILPLDSSLR
ncbi:MAG: tetratricopeptide repeat protein [Desulfomonile tiedjei]|uniref:Tetratricopeptide repeat protein n=1 Tax=Desulfomonile tiedjei TaxID=2358 RepID=A0A9D6Z2Q1_9BACT|nr:tetratricopeptide repeat protein [Desulfomonile tiedjei]